MSTTTSPAPANTNTKVQANGKATNAMASGAAPVPSQASPALAAKATPAAKLASTSASASASTSASTSTAGQGSVSTTNNLLTNGGFELGALGPGQQATGWSSYGPGGGLHNEATRRSEGQQSYAIGGWSNLGGGGIKQTVNALKVGQRYGLWFDAGAMHNQLPAGSTAKLDVVITSGDGKTLQRRTLEFAGPTAMGRYELFFVASDDKATVRFEIPAGQGAASAYDADVDNVLLQESDNLLANSGFELGAVGQSAPVPGWSQGGPGGGVYNAASRVSEGSKSFALGGWSSQTGGYVQQSTQGLKEGQRYVLSFGAGSLYNNVAADKPVRLKVQVTSGSGRILKEDYFEFRGQEPMSQRELEFVATDDKATVRFELPKGQESSQDYDLDLDDVQLRQQTTAKQYVYIRKNEGINDHLALAEVKLYDSQGRALQVTGLQSSSSFSGTPDKHKASNLIDGVTAGNASQNGIYASQGTSQAWVQLEVSAAAPLGRIDIYGRTDQWATQNGNFSVYVGTSPMAGLSHAELKNTAGVSYFVQSGQGNAQVQINTATQLTRVTPQTANLIVNGGFEISEGTGALTQALGWTSGGGAGGGVHNVSSRISEGGQAFALGGWSTKAGGWTQQRVSGLQMGYDHTLSFDAGSLYNQNTNNTPAQLKVLVSDNQGRILKDELLVFYGKQSLKRYELTFLATSSDVTVRFELPSTQNASAAADYDIDLDRVGLRQTGTTLVPNTPEIVRNLSIAQIQGIDTAIIQNLPVNALLAKVLIGGFEIPLLNFLGTEQLKVLLQSKPNMVSLLSDKQLDDLRQANALSTSVYKAEIQMRRQALTQEMAGSFDVGTIRFKEELFAKNAYGNTLLSNLTPEQVLGLSDAVLSSLSTAELSALSGAQAQLLVASRRLVLSYSQDQLLAQHIAQNYTPSKNPEQANASASQAVQNALSKIQLKRSLSAAELSVLNGSLHGRMLQAEFLGLSAGEQTALLATDAEALVSILALGLEREAAASVIGFLFGPIGAGIAIGAYASWELYQYLHPDHQSPQQTRNSLSASALLTLSAQTIATYVARPDADPAQINAHDVADAVAQLTPSQAQSLSAEQLQALGPYVAMLSNAAVQALYPWQFVKANGQSIYELVFDNMTPLQQSLLSNASSVSSIEQVRRPISGLPASAYLSEFQVASFGQDIVGQLSTNDLRQLSYTRFGPNGQPLSILQMLTETQLGQLSSATASGLSASELQGGNMAQAQRLMGQPITVLQQLSLQAQRAITASVLRQLPSSALLLPSRQGQVLNFLLPAQIQALSSAQIASLEASALRSTVMHTGRSVLATLTYDQLEAINGLAWSQLSLSDLQENSAIGGFSNPNQVETILSLMPPSAIANLSEEVVAQLSSAQLSRVNPYLQELGVGNLQAFFEYLSDSQVAALSTSALAGLSTAQVNALPDGGILSMTATQIAQIVRHFSDRQFALLSTDQVAGLSAQELGQARGHADGSGGEVVLEGLNRLQVRDITNAVLQQINGLHLARRTVSTGTVLAALSTAQLAALSQNQLKDACYAFNQNWIAAKLAYDTYPNPSIADLARLQAALDAARQDIQTLPLADLLKDNKVNTVNALIAGDVSLVLRMSDSQLNTLSTDVFKALLEASTYNAQVLLSAGEQDCVSVQQLQEILKNADIGQIDYRLMDQLSEQALLSLTTAQIGQLTARQLLQICSNDKLKWVVLKAGHEGDYWSKAQFQALSNRAIGGGGFTEITLPEVVDKSIFSADQVANGLLMDSLLAEIILTDGENDWTPEEQASWIALPGVNQYIEFWGHGGGKYPAGKTEKVEQEAIDFNALTEEQLLSDVVKSAIGSKRTAVRTIANVLYCMLKYLPNESDESKLKKYSELILADNFARLFKESLHNNISYEFIGLFFEKKMTNYEFTRINSEKIVAAINFAAKVEILAALNNLPYDSTVFASEQKLKNLADLLGEYITKDNFFYICKNNPSLIGKMSSVSKVKFKAFAQMTAAEIKIELRKIYQHDPTVLAAALPGISTALYNQGDTNKPEDLEKIFAIYFLENDQKKVLNGNRELAYTIGTTYDSLVIFNNLVADNSIKKLTLKDLDESTRGNYVVNDLEISINQIYFKNALESIKGFRGINSTKLIVETIFHEMRHVTNRDSYTTLLEPINAELLGIFLENKDKKDALDITEQLNKILELDCEYEADSFLAQTNLHYTNFKRIEAGTTTDNNKIATAVNNDMKNYWNDLYNNGYRAVSEKIVQLSGLELDDIGRIKNSQQNLDIINNEHVKPIYIENEDSFYFTGITRIILKFAQFSKNNDLNIGKVLFMDSSKLWTSTTWLGYGFYHGYLDFMSRKNYQLMPGINLKFGTNCHEIVFKSKTEAVVSGPDAQITFIITPNADPTTPGTMTVATEITDASKIADPGSILCDSTFLLANTISADALANLTPAQAANLKDNFWQNISDGQIAAMFDQGKQITDFFGGNNSYDGTQISSVCLQLINKDSLANGLKIASENNETAVLDFLNAKWVDLRSDQKSSIKKKFPDYNPPTSSMQEPLAGQTLAVNPDAQRLLQSMAATPSPLGAAQTLPSTSLDKPAYTLTLPS